MYMPEPDPIERLFKEQYAPAEQMRHLEITARNLLEEMPTECLKMYGIENELGVLMLRSVYEDNRPWEVCAVVEVDNLEQETLLRIDFDPTDAAFPVHMPETQLKEAAVVLHTMLKDGIYDSRIEAVARTAYDYVVDCVKYRLQLPPVYPFNTGGEVEKPFAEVIRNVLDDLVPNVLRYREWDIILPGERSISIAENTVDLKEGFLSDVIEPNSPTLEIELEDRAAALNLYYVRCHNGDTAVYTESAAEIMKYRELTPEEMAVEDDLDDMLDNFDAFRPTSTQIDRIQQALYEGAVLDAETPDTLPDYIS